MNMDDAIIAVTCAVSRSLQTYDADYIDQQNALDGLLLVLRDEGSMYSPNAVAYCKKEILLVVAAINTRRGIEVLEVRY